jgi:hypothetical protein
LLPELAVLFSQRSPQRRQLSVGIIARGGAALLVDGSCAKRTRICARVLPYGRAL